MPELYREFEALRASITGSPDQALSQWDAVLLERTRRAVILVLRHQALSIRQQYVERCSLSGYEESEAARVLEPAFRLLSAATQLHREDDADAPATAYSARFIRRTLTLANWKPAIVAPGSRTPQVPTRLSRRRLLYAAAALVVAFSGAFAIVRSGKVGVPNSPRVGSADPVPAVVATLSASPVGSAVSAPVPTPPATVVIVLQSDPGGASVKIGGEDRGSTPLRIEGKPRQSVAVVLRKGNRLWRGTLTFSDESEKVVSITLPVARVPKTPHPRRNWLKACRGYCLGRML